MSIKRADLLIRRARVRSQQLEYDADYGIPQEFFIDSLNECNTEINKILVAESSEPFATYAEDDVVANQEAYALPTDIFSSNMVYSIEFSPDGQTANYYTLDLMYRREPTISGYPEQYFVDNGNYYLFPVPASTGGKLRVRYEKRLDRLDIPRGLIVDVPTIGDSSISLQLNTAAPFPLPDSAAFIPDDIWEAVCIVDNIGTMRYRNCRQPLYPWTATTSFYDTASDILYVQPPSGENPGDVQTEIQDIVSNGDYQLYVVAGLDSTCFSPLPDHFESIFVSWMLNDVQLHLSSMDLSATKEKFYEQIVKAAEIFAQLPAGKKPIPEHRRDWY